ncbi:MAG: hypothetical protein JNN05_05265 [Candidatus Omnitrophica bacterium]|nr:hypothetical protein [Candidatus Omnitrophota bacterium]
MNRPHRQILFVMMAAFSMFSRYALAQENQNVSSLAYPHFQVSPRSEDSRKEDAIVVKTPVAERPDNNITAMPPKAREQFDRNEEANRSRLEERRGHDRDANRRWTPGGFVTQTPTGLKERGAINPSSGDRSHRRYPGHDHRHYRYNVHRHAYSYDPVVVVNYGPSVVIPDGYDSIAYGGVNYYYNDGQFYVASGGQLVDAYPPMGAVIMRLPEDRAEVLMGGDNYYVYAGVFYQRYGSGYRVSVPPFSSDASNGVLITSRQNVTVRLPRENGGYKEIYLMATSDGYKGPQGEVYTEFPSIDQLQEMYGE